MTNAKAPTTLIVRLLAFTLLASFTPRHAPAAARFRAQSAPSTPVDCEGDACSAVTFAFDGSKQQYRAQNNSADRWVKVSASNLAASSSACLAPGKGDYLPLKSLVGDYRADYAEAKCGEQVAGL